VGSNRETPAQILPCRRLIYEAATGNETAFGKAPFCPGRTAAIFAVPLSGKTIAGQAKKAYDFLRLRVRFGGDRHGKRGVCGMQREQVAAMRGCNSYGYMIGRIFRFRKTVG
jgi:hypothetical protein